MAVKTKINRAIEMTEEDKIIEVIKAARYIQEFLWADMNDSAGLEEFKRMFRKRVSKIEDIDINNPHWRVELKKRCLQTAAICVNLMNKLDHGLINSNDNQNGLRSNLSNFYKKIK